MSRPTSHFPSRQFRSGVISVVLSALCTATSAFEYCERLNTPSFFDHFTVVTGLTNDCEASDRCTALRWEGNDSLGILMYTGDPSGERGVDMREVVMQFAEQFTNATGVPVEINEQVDVYASEPDDIDLYIAYGDAPFLDKLDAAGMTEFMNVSRHRTALSTQGRDGVCSSLRNFDGALMERSLTVLSANGSSRSNRSCVVQALIFGSGFSELFPGSTFVESEFSWFEVSNHYALPDNFQQILEVLHALPQAALNSRADLVAFRQSECGSE